MIGYRLKGIYGAIAATVGLVLPTFILALIASKFLLVLKDNLILHSILQGIQACVVAFIIYAAIKLFKGAIYNVGTWVLFLLSLGFLFVGISPVAIIGVGILLELLNFIIHVRKEKSNV